MADQGRADGHGTDPTRTVAVASAAGLAALPGVVAVVLEGSRAGALASPDSDVDLYVYAEEPPPASARVAVAAALEAGEIEVDNRFWETEDDWGDGATGLGVEVIYRSPDGIAGELNRVLVRHEASVGYSTALWRSVRASEALVDPTGWYGRLRERAAIPYPEPLRRAIVTLNHPILRERRATFRHQIELSHARGDWVAANHRVAALLASFFDVLFALNRTTHPGEKRLLAQAAASCPRRPADLERLVTRAGVLAATAPGPPPPGQRFGGPDRRAPRSARRAAPGGGADRVGRALGRVRLLVKPGRRRAPACGGCRRGRAARWRGSGPRWRRGGRGGAGARPTRRATARPR